jgi:hypothetical protein
VRHPALPQASRSDTASFTVAVGARWIPAICLLFGSACSSGNSAGDRQAGNSLRQPTVPPACGRPTPLEPTPVPDETAPGAHVGPLWFVFGGTADTAQSKIYPDNQGLLSPTKVPIVIRERLPRPVTLRGWRCADGTPLRFWYRRQGDVPLPRNPASPGELERAGDLVATLSGEPTIPGIPGYHGYLLFSATGKWVVSVALRGQRVGSFVVNVTAG